MMAPGFKPVGWVAAVAASAIGCYMLSLNVASERAELLRIERQIVDTKRDIRSLQIELGTRGRMAQLEQWNAEVLALSAPTTSQFLEDEVRLARFDQTMPSAGEPGNVRMAAAEITPTPVRPPVAPVVLASAPPAPAAALARSPLVRQASLSVPAARIHKAGASSAEAAKPAASAKSVRTASVADSAVRPVRTTSPAGRTVKPVRTASAGTVPAPIDLLQQLKPASRIDAGLVQQITAAARLEATRGGR